MLDVRLASSRGVPATVAVPVPSGDVPAAVALLREADRGEAKAFLSDVEHKGAAGTLHALPRPARRPARLLFVGIGDGDAAGWRRAGAALAHGARKEPALTVLLPPDVGADAVGGLAEGLWLASYRFRLGADDPEAAPKLRRVTLNVAAHNVAAHRSGVPDGETGSAGGDRSDGGGASHDGELAAAVAKARAIVKATVFARDLTNTPSDRKTPAWLARQVEKAAAGVAHLTVAVRMPRQLTEEGFNGILAVGGGSVHSPRLVELSWRPRVARRHVVLVGKGVTFDTGGICIKSPAGMKLMRKDMGGAAAVVAATVGAATLRLPVRITALAPLAENSLGADAYRPGDVVRHYGGTTSEITNTDAEGRLVLADAIAYAVRRLRPDFLVDLATLTGAQGVALGKRTAALFSESDPLADTLREAAEAAGEAVWRMPLADDYVEALGSEVADLVNSTDIGAGAVMGALYLREFTGPLRDRWAHLDMSSSAWADSTESELSKGATGWGVRTLLRWLESIAG